MDWKFNRAPSVYPSRTAYQCAYHKAKRRARFRAGLCRAYTCETPREPGRRACAAHLAHYSAQTVRRRSAKPKRQKPPALVDLLDNYDAVL